MNVTTPLQQVARQRPDAPALIHAGGQIATHAALERHIDAFATRALAVGLRPGQTVGLTIGWPDEALALVLALALARIGVASADVDLPAAAMDGCFVQPGGGTTAGARILNFDAGWSAPPVSFTGAASIATPHPDPAAIFRVFATSGTTGTPRFCALSHADMAARIEAASYAMPNGGRDLVTICALGLGGTSAQRVALTTLGGGGALVFTNPTDWANDALRHRVNFLATSPNTLQTLLGRIPAGAGPLPGLATVHVTGSQLPAPLAAAAAVKICPDVVTLFGATEAGAVAFGHYASVARTPLCVGIVAPSATVQAVDGAHRPLPAGEVGALRMRTPGMATHYLHDDPADATAFRDGWFYSGDLGHVGAGGELIVTGRAGEFINSGGVKISPRVIEDVLLALPGVTQAAAFGAPDVDGLAKIWAAIVADPPIAGAALQDWCVTSLGVRAPDFILQMPDLPRNANGKVLMGELIAYAARRTGARSG